MKKHTLFKSILIVLLAFVICSFIFPTSEGTVIGENLNRIGIYNIFNAIFIAFKIFLPYAIYLISVAGLYMVLNKTDVYQNIVNRLSKSLKKKKTFFLILVTILFSVISSVTNFGIILFIIIPLIISILIKLNYDKFICFCSTFGAIIVGIVGSTIGYNINHNIINIVNNGIKDTNSLLTVYDNIYIKIILLIISTTLLIIYMLSHIKKVNNNKVKKEEVNDKLLVEKDNLEKRGITLPLIFISIILALITLTSIIWGVYKIDIFTKFYEWLNNAKVYNFEIFKNIFGGSLASGELNGFHEFGFIYYSDTNLLLSDLSILIILSTFIISFIYKLKLSEIFTSFKDGIKKVGNASFLIVFAFSIFLLSFYVPILNSLIILTADSFNIITSVLTFVVASILNIDIALFGNNLVNYVTILSGTSVSKIIEILVQTIYGFTMFFAPTSVLLILGLNYLDIKYSSWLKFIFKFLIQLFILILVVLLILVII